MESHSTPPTLWQFKPSKGTYTSYTPDGTPQTVAIAVAEPGKGDPFEGQYGLSTNFSVVQGRLTGDDADTYTARLIEQFLNIEKNGGIFTAKFLKNILDALDQKIYDQFSEKAMVAGDSTAAVKKYLLPNGEAPMVEWALVVTPIYRFECYAPFYCSPSAGITHTNFGLPYVGGGNCVALDAYWFAQYECTSLAL